MATKTFSFEAGVNAANVTSGAGEASADQWNAVFGTAPIYDNTKAAAGTLSGKQAAGNADLKWTLASPSEEYGRAYLWLTAIPSVNFSVYMTRAAGSLKSEIDIQSGTGKLRVSGVAGSGVTVGSVAAATGQWVRVEWHIINSATAGMLEAKLFNTATSSTPTDTVTSILTANTGTAIDDGRFVASTATSAYPLWIDQIVGNASAYPGPFPVNTVAPAVTGLTPVGSTLSCDGGTWNGTFTLAYQWTRDGSNIASATSSTYTTVSADSGHSIGCTVTATGVQATNESASTASNTITAGAASSSGVIRTGAESFLTIINADY